MAVDEARNDCSSILPSVTGSDGCPPRVADERHDPVVVPHAAGRGPRRRRRPSRGGTSPSRASPPPPPHAPSRKLCPVSSTRADQPWVGGRSDHQQHDGWVVGRVADGRFRPAGTSTASHCFIRARPSRPASPPRPRAPGGSRRRRRRGPARCPATPGGDHLTRGVLLQERASPWLVVGERHQVPDVEGLHRRPGTDVPGCVRWLHSPLLL